MTMRGVTSLGLRCGLAVVATTAACVVALPTSVLLIEDVNLLGGAEHVRTGRLEIASDYGSELRVRVGHDFVAIGGTGLRVSPDELARIRLLVGEQVTAGLHASESLEAGKLAVVMDRHRVCLHAEDRARSVVAARDRMVQQATWKEDIRGWKTGAWGAFLASLPRSEGHDVSLRVQGLLAGDREHLAADIVAWWLEDPRDRRPRPGVRLDLNELLWESLSDDGEFALAVFEVATGMMPHTLMRCGISIRDAGSVPHRLWLILALRRQLRW